MQLLFQVRLGRGGRRAGWLGAAITAGGAGAGASTLGAGAGVGGVDVPWVNSKISKMTATIPAPTNTPVSQDGMPVGELWQARIPGPEPRTPVRPPKPQASPRPLLMEHRTHGKIPDGGRRARRTGGKRCPPVPDAARNCRTCCNSAGQLHTGLGSGGIEAWWTSGAPKSSRGKFSKISP